MKPERCYICGWFFLKGEEPIEFEGEYICSPCKTKIKMDELSRQHASLSGGDLVATECPKCGASLIDMDWDLLKVDGGALLCDGCDYAFTEPPKPLGRG